MARARSVVLLASIAIALLITWSHARLHYGRSRTEDGRAILQVRLEALTPEVLAERLPTVIEDGVVDPARSLPRSAFRWQHLWASPRARPCRLGAFEPSRARFTLIFFSDADSSGVVVIRPDEEKPKGAVVAEAEPAMEVEVRLEGGKVLVLPPGWSSMPLSPGASRVSMHDAFTLLFRLLF